MNEQRDSLIRESVWDIFQKYELANDPSNIGSESPPDNDSLRENTNLVSHIMLKRDALNGKSERIFDHLRVNFPQFMLFVVFILLVMVVAVKFKQKMSTK